MSKLSKEIKANYFKEIVIPTFKPLINRKTYSTIFNDDYEIIACTNLTAHSVGADSWEELIGYSYKNYDDEKLAKQIFKGGYNLQTSKVIHIYAKKIFQIQQYALKEGRAVNFVDLLPYNNVFKSFLISYIPIFHPTGEVIGIQGFSAEIRFFGFQDHLVTINPDEKHLEYFPQKELSIRETEILFLLTNGITQEQIAQILGVHRSTVATTISNLCVKFGIAGTNTRILTQAGIQQGYYKYVPSSLWHPYIILLDEEVSLQIFPDKK